MVAMKKVEIDHGCRDGGSGFLRHRALFADCENGMKKVQQMLMFSLAPLLMVLGDKIVSYNSVFIMIKEY